MSEDVLGSYEKNVEYLFSGGSAFILKMEKIDDWRFYRSFWIYSGFGLYFVSLFTIFFEVFTAFSFIFFEESLLTIT